MTFRIGTTTVIDSSRNLVNVNVGSSAGATQAEAEAGSNNTRIMTPLRTAQAIAALTGAKNDIFYENAQVIAQSYTIPATRNAMTTGPVEINAGVTVTVSSGARWVVI